MADSRYAGEAGLQAVFGQIKAAMAEKQDKINDMGLSHNDYSNAEKQKNAQNASDIVALNNDIDDIIEKMDGDATLYQFAPVVTVEDAVPGNVALRAKVEPTQELHGYDKPWPAGGGKNIMKIDLSNDSSTAAGMDFSHTDDTFTLQGTASSTFRIFNFDKVPPIKANLPYVLSVEIVGSLPKMQLTMYVGNSQGESLGNLKVIANGAGKYASSAVTLNEDVASSTFTIEGLQASGEYDCTVKVQLEQNTQATDWSPYSNICPITGHTEASVQRDGVNIADGIVRPIVCGQNNVYVNTTLPIGSIVVPIVGGRDYTVSIKNAQTIFTSTCAEFPENGDTTVDAMSGTSGASVTHKTVSTSANAKYLVVHTGSHDYEEFQVELGSTATPYVPYAGKTYTIALGDTIYGGTVDFDSGVMTVDRVKIVQNDATNVSQLTALTNTTRITTSLAIQAKSNNESLCKCNYLEYLTNYVYDAPHYYVESNAFIAFYPGVMNGDEWRAYVAANPLEIVYPIATPFTVQLTPQQIQLLKGTNTLTASTGQISVTVNGVSGSIGAVQEQVNELAADIAEQLPTAPTTDGAYVLTVTVADGTPTYSWESAT
jgi:hypothetical protein